MPTDRLPPFNDAAERSVLGCILLEATRVMPLCLQAKINPKSFYVQAHQSVWSTMEAMYSRGNIIDSLSVESDLSTSGKLDGIGGESTLLKWMDDAITPAHASYHIEIIRKAELKRVGIDLCQSAEANLYNASDDDLAGVIAKVQTDWCQIDAGKQDNRSLSEIASELITDWEKPRNPETQIRWPLESMNRHMGTLTDELVYIASRESVGKTAFAVQMAVQLGFAGVPVAFASLESKKDKLVQRMIAMIGRCNTLNMRFGMNPNARAFDLERGHEAAEKMKRLNITIDDTGMNTDQIRAFAQMQQARGAKLLIIDNMKHIRPIGSVKGKSVVEQFRDLAQGIKWIRDDLSMPVIVLHHLNKLGDVSWSDDIRRDADVLLFLTVNDDESTPYTPQNRWQGKTIIDVDCEKAREGRRGYTLKTEFIPHHQTFIEVDQQSEEENTDDPM